jgi:hypothetical protein
MEKKVIERNKERGRTKGEKGEREAVYFVAHSTSDI